MKKFIFAVLVLIGLAVWIMFSSPEDGGYLLIAFGTKTVEMSLWLAGLLLLALWLVLWVVWRILSGGAQMARSVSGFFFHGSSARAQKRTQSGLIDFIEGNWLQAHKKLVRAAPRVEAPLINYLAAARSAHEMHDPDEVNRLLAIAAQSSPEQGAIAVALTRARIELEEKRYDQCLATLLAVKDEAPDNRVLLDLLRRVYVARQDWEGLHNIFDSLRRYKVDSPEALDALEVRLYRERLQHQGEASRQLLRIERLSVLRAGWNKVPGKLQKNPQLISVYAHELALSGEDQEAEVLLRKTLSKDWRDDMVYLYGRLHIEDSRLQMRVAEEWATRHAREPVLLLTLGRISLRNELWGKARDYFRESLALRKDPEVYAELARLLENMGEQQQSNESYQSALELTVARLPQLPQPRRI